MIIYVSIGNSDDKLTQYEWAQFVGAVRAEVNAWAKAVHGAWLSVGDSPWQNACWCVEIPGEHAQGLRGGLAKIRERFRQESIAWAAAETEFI